MAAITTTGAVPRTAAEYVDDIAAAYLREWPHIDLSPSTPQGQFIGTLAQAFAQRDQELVDALNAFSIDTASARQLDNLVSLIGLTRGDGESNIDLRSRYRAALGANETGTREGLLARIRALDGVTHCEIANNPSAAEATISGLTVAAFSFTTCVRGGTDANIARTIGDHKPMGITTSGSTSESVTYSDGVTEAIRFERVATLDVAVTATLTTTSDFPSNGADLVGTALVEYFAGLHLGQLHDVGRASAVMYNAAPGFTLGTPTFTQVGGTAIPATLTLAQQLVLEESNVSITLTS